jgi:hypothetical protein
MNLTQFFDASIKLQNYGYNIYSIKEDEYKNYFVTFAYADVCSALAFGGIKYTIDFGPTPRYVYKEEPRTDVYINQKVSTIDEAVDFIIADIQKLEQELKEQERQKVLDKLTQRERELLGV